MFQEELREQPQLHNYVSNLFNKARKSFFVGVVIGGICYQILIQIWRFLKREHQTVQQNQNHLISNGFSKKVIEIEEHQFDTELLGIIEKTFSLSELKELCFILGVDFERLPGEEKLIKILELIKYCRRRNLSNQLWSKLKSLRPALDLVSGAKQ